MLKKTIESSLVYIFYMNIPKSVHCAAYKRQGEQRKLN